MPEAVVPPVKPEYQHQSFPKYVFRGRDSKVVHDEEAFEAAKADGWGETPEPIDPEAPASTTAPVLSGNPEQLAQQLHAQSLEIQKLRGRVEAQSAEIAKLETEKAEVEGVVEAQKIQIEELTKEVQDVTDLIGTDEETETSKPKAKKGHK